MLLERSGSYCTAHAGTRLVTAPEVAACVTYSLYKHMKKILNIYKYFFLLFK